MSPLNDQTCGWINNLPQRSFFKTLNSSFECDFLATFKADVVFMLKILFKSL